MGYGEVWSSKLGTKSPPNMLISFLLHSREKKRHRPINDDSHDLKFLWLIFCTICKFTFRYKRIFLHWDILIFCAILVEIQGRLLDLESNIYEGRGADRPLPCVARKRCWYTVRSRVRLNPFYELKHSYGNDYSLNNNISF